MPLYVTKRLSIDQIKSGMKLAKPIYLDDGDIILEAGIPLSPGMIERLRTREIKHVEIREERADTFQPLRQYVTKVDRKLAPVYNETLSTIAKAFDSAHHFKKAPAEGLRDFADKTVTHIVQTPGALNFVQLIHQTAGYTFQHSLDVSIIAGVFGRWLGLKGQDLQDLILAGLLHDIGKIEIPVEILDKPSALSEEEMKLVRSHTLLGYRLLKDSKLPLHILAAVVQHHERIDGSGYPFHLTKEKIHWFAQVIAIAEIYDTIISDQPYRSKLSPIEALKEIQAEMFSRLDPAICSVFLENIKAYLVGNIVRLNDGRTAEIVYLAEYMSHRPLVLSEDGEFINLDTAKDLYIVDMPSLELDKS